jgi:hypothetical protein
LRAVLLRDAQLGEFGTDLVEGCNDLICRGQQKEFIGIWKFSCNRFGFFRSVELICVRPGKKRRKL